jgi:predicted short-subunit dehydrogenase-like oxidoreductase (DUF2520 family)
MTRIGFLGAGRVAVALSRAFTNAGERVEAGWSRSRESAQRLAARVALASAQDVAERCDIVFVAVPDDAIEAVARSVRWPPGVAAVHCSGAADPALLDGSFHPLLMFADPDIAVAALKRCAIAVDGAPPLVTELERLARAIGAEPIRVPAEGRAAYHAASHYAAAFLCVLLAEGEAIFGRLGLDGRQALVALARSALDAVEAQGPARAMAGTYSRGDIGTAKRHLQALDPAFLPLYRTLALKSIGLAEQAGRIDAARAGALRALLR